MIEYSANYSKTSGILWQFYTDVPADRAIVDFNVAIANTASFNPKVKLTGQTSSSST